MDSNQKQTEKTMAELERAIGDYLTTARLEHSGTPEVNEAELARLVDRFLAGESVPAAYANGIIEIAAAIRLMDSSAVPNATVPDVLRHVVASTLTSKKQTPSIVVRLSRKGLSLVKSTLAGLELAPQAAVAVRSAATAEVTPRLEMTQVVGNGLGLEYQVMQESNAEMMLVIRFLDRPQGVYRVDLRKEDRLVSSQMVKLNGDSVSFTRISGGGYQVDIAGPVNHSFGIFVSAEE